MTPPLVFSPLEDVRAPGAVLDDWGEIVFVNCAWRIKAGEHWLGPWGDVGSNYLEACQGAGACRSALAIANGIKDVARGWRDECHVEYLAGAADAPRWFVAHILQHPGRGPMRVVVIHEDVTARRTAVPPHAQSPSDEPVASKPSSPVIAMESLLAPIDDSEQEHETLR